MATAHNKPRDLVVIGVEVDARTVSGDIVRFTIYPLPYGFRCHDSQGISVNDPLTDYFSLSTSPLKQQVTRFCQEVARAHADND